MTLETVQTQSALLPAAPPPGALRLIVDLCAALEEAGVAWCHWKSNAALDRSATGENDLDLLIHPASAGRFAGVLARFDFRLTFPPADERIPGILDYYGLDAPSGRLVHVHAHHSLTVGHDFTKNIHLPIEQAYVQSARMQGIFRVPAPELEYLLLVIRLMLKHAAWETLALGHGEVPPGARGEMTYLQERLDRGRLHALLIEHLPCVSPELFAACEHALQPGAGLGAKLNASGRLFKALRPFARRSRAADVLLKFSRRITRGLHRRVFRTARGKRLADGGRVIAIIGGDGAGKTTAIEGLTAWLKPDFALQRVHMGKPEWSLTTRVVRGLLKVGRVLGLYPFMRVPMEYKHDVGAQAFPGLPWLVREVCTARDRALTYARARRFAADGGLVICDRFPVAQITFMDGPQAPRMTAGLPPNRWIERLTRLEASFYRSILPPDLLIVLRVDPDVAVRRKTTEDPADVRARSQEVWEVDWSASNALVIDASRSPEEVLAALRALIWSSL